MLISLLVFSPFLSLFSLSFIIKLLSDLIGTEYSQSILGLFKSFSADISISLFEWRGNNLNLLSLISSDVFSFIFFSHSLCSFKFILFWGNSFLFLLFASSFTSFISFSDISIKFLFFDSSFWKFFPSIAFLSSILSSSFSKIEGISSSLLLLTFLSSFWGFKLFFISSNCSSVLLTLFSSSLL